MIKLDTIMICGGHKLLPEKKEFIRVKDAYGFPCGHIVIINHTSRHIWLKEDLG